VINAKGKKVSPAFAVLPISSIRKGGEYELEGGRKDVQGKKLRGGDTGVKKVRQWGKEKKSGHLRS